MSLWGTSETAKLRAEVRRLRKALQSIVNAELILAMYHGGETYSGLNHRIKEIAKEALKGGFPNEAE